MNQIVQTEAIRPFLVFALGTNDPWADNETSDKGYLDTVQSMVGSDTAIILTTSISRNYDFSENNRFLRQAAQRYPNVYLADWEQDFQEEYYLIDGVHYTNEGHLAFLKTIKRTIEKAAIIKLLR